MEIKYLHREEEEEEEETNQMDDKECPSPDHIDPISGIYIGDIVEERDLKEAKLTHVTRKLVGVACIQPTVQQGKKEEEGEESRVDRCLPVRWRGIDLVKQKGRPEWF